MANVSKDFGWDIGEYSHNAVLEEVEFAGTLEPGDVVKFTGINSSGQMKAVKHTGTDIPRGVVAKKQGGVSGDIRAIVVRGDVVALFGDSHTAGGELRVKGGKFVNTSTAGASTKSYGFSRSVPTGDGDYGLICFISY